MRGLTGAQVRERTEHGLVNRVRSPVSRTALAIIRSNVFTRFNALLGALCTVILLTGPWQDALFGGVVIVNALIGIVQELRAKWTLDRLAILHQPKVHAWRDGSRTELAAEDIVVDDILELAPGDQAVVDVVVLQAGGLEVDESLLTGESAPVARQVGDEVLSGSIIVAGSGTCRVTRVGGAAFGQQLAGEARRFSLAHSELRAGIDRIMRYVTWAVVPTSALLFSNQFIVDGALTGALLFSAGGVVAMVPEGLVLLTSLALAVAAIQLARQHMLVQDLPATEALARVDVVCLDKTGTLTGREPHFERIEPVGAGHSDVAHVLSTLANADPRPNATLRAIGRAFPEEPPQPVTGHVPFSSARKWSAVMLGVSGSWVLGAPEVLLEPTADSALLRDRAAAHAREGWRVLLLARTQAALAGEHLPDNLEAVAFVLLSEQIREDAASTLGYLHAQGVSVKVFSGDHPATVGRIAARLGIADAADAVDAATLPQESPEFFRLAETHQVFGRLSPMQKRSLVAALQEHGHRVAMVGDGINDVLALKYADVGIAMADGAAATRAVAHLVLLDNRFAGLPGVIAEGRRVIANVERLAALFLTKTVYAMILALVVGVAGVTFPFLPRHLTLVGSLTIGLPAFFLSLERTAQRVRPGFVDRVLRFAVLSGLFVAGATFAAYIGAGSELGLGLVQSRTVATVVLDAVATWVLVLVARPLTAVRWLVLAAMVVAFAIVYAVAPLRTFFALGLLPLKAWVFATVVTVLTGVLLSRGAAIAARPHRRTIRFRPLRIRDMVQWITSGKSPKWTLMLAMVLVVGGLWLFFWVLEDVLGHEHLGVADMVVYHVVQSLRSPAVDRLMVIATELGDAQVLLPVMLVALAWFLVHRNWLTAGYWLAAIGVAEVLANIMKLALHRSRPGSLYSGAAQFSFPSGHTMMGMIVYGFLAYLIARQAAPALRRLVVAVTVTLIGLIAVSRVYLGAHWLSDVLGGLSFGVAWVAAFAVAYEYQSHDRLRPPRFAVAMLVTLLIAGTAHVAGSCQADLLRYAPKGAARR